MSSREGAGSTEHISTGTLEFARVLKDKAAEMVVFPTPPLPTTNVSGVFRTGHLEASRRISGAFGVLGFHFIGLPSKT